MKILYFYLLCLFTMIFISCSNFQINLNDFCGQNFSKITEIIKSKSENSDEKLYSANPKEFIFNFTLLRENQSFKFANLEDFIFYPEDLLILDNITDSNHREIQISPSKIQMKLCSENKILAESKNQLSFASQNFLFDSPQQFVLIISFPLEELILEAKFYIKSGNARSLS